MDYYPLLPGKPANSHSTPVPTYQEEGLKGLATDFCDAGLIGQRQWHWHQSRALLQQWLQGPLAMMYPLNGLALVLLVLFADAAQATGTAGAKLALCRHLACVDYCNQAAEKAAQAVSLLRFGRMST